MQGAELSLTNENSRETALSSCASAEDITSCNCAYRNGDTGAPGSGTYDMGSMGSSRSVLGLPRIEPDNPNMSESHSLMSTLEVLLGSLVQPVLAKVKLHDA